jgi:hypothetical protein
VSGVSNNNDQDPAGSTQMFRAFANGATPNAPTPTPAPAKSGGAGKVIGIVVAVVVVAVIVYIAVH